MLRNTSKKRSRAILLLLASTGCRIGAAPDLKIKNLSQMPDGCKSVLFYEGSNEEYYGFLTPEASKALDEYLEERQKDGEKLTQDSPLFRAKYLLGFEKVKLMTSDTLQQVIHALVKPNVNRTKIGLRYNIQAAHGLRKRFATIVKMDSRVSYSISERLLGHQAYLDKEYMRPTKEAMFKEFQKVIPELTVSDSERDKIKITTLEVEKTEIENMKKRIDDLEYGPEKRAGTYALQMADPKINLPLKIIVTIFNLWVAMRKTEEEKRKILRTMNEAIKNGEVFDLAPFLESKN